jgi:hypothetical protein
MSFYKNRTVIITAAVLVLVLVVAFVPVLEKEYTELKTQTVTETYYESEPYTEIITEIVISEQTSHLFSHLDPFNIIDTGRKIFTKEIDITDKTDNIINGYVKMFQGIHCNFYVVSEQYYLLHAVYTVNPPEEYYVGIDNAEYQTFSFVPDYSGTYYFVFTAYEPVPDYYMGELNKFDADWYWQQEIEQQTEVESYHDVAKQREVTKEVEVIEVKRVSLLRYLLN